MFTTIRNEEKVKKRVVTCFSRGTYKYSHQQPANRAQPQAPNRKPANTAPRNDDKVLPWDQVARLLVEDLEAGEWEF
jgi:hypothetical protein